MNKSIVNKKMMLVIAYSIPILLLFIVYFSNRSLFLDGLNLARNVAEGTFSDFLLPLKYEQSAPVLFLFISKFFTIIFGVSEFSLRLLPLLSGIACLFFFGSISKKILDINYMIIGLVWFGTHSMFIRYATEYKQYITDAFVCVFLIWLALKTKELTKKNILFIGLAGTFAIWLSMPSVFVLVGILAYFLSLQYESNKPLFPIIMLTAWFAFNFLMEYLFILSPAIRSDHMQNFHQNYFLQGRFWEINSLKHDFGLIVSILRMAVGKSGLAIAISLGLIILSIYNLVKSRKKIGLLLVLPILVVFGASLLGKYSLIERLMLFILPLIILLILMGLQIVVKWISNKNIILKYSTLLIIGVALLIGFSQRQGLKYIFSPLEIEDNRTALLHINQHEKNQNTIICTQLAHPSFAYYSNYDINYKNLNLGKAIAAKYEDSIISMAVTQSNKENNDVWILMGHMLEDEITKLIKGLEKEGTIKNSYRTNKSAAILFSTQ